MCHIAWKEVNDTGEADCSEKLFNHWPHHSYASATVGAMIIRLFLLCDTSDILSSWGTLQLLLVLCIHISAFP